MVELLNGTEHLRDVGLGNTQRRTRQGPSITSLRECAPKVFAFTRLTDFIV